MEYFYTLIVIILSFILFCYLFRAKDGLPTNWPIVGMLPAVLKNRDRIHDYIIELMEKCQMTTYIGGPWFFNLNFIVTVDPANIDHVFSKNFGNYGKGSTFHEIFEVLGDGIFNTEASLWKYHRSLNHSFFNQPKFQSRLVNTIWDEIEFRLTPLFDHVIKNGIEIDLVDVFERITFDNILTVLMNHNPNFLSIAFPPITFSKAVADMEEIIYKRHLLPISIWKSLKWLCIIETNHKKVSETIDDFVFTLINKRREERSRTRTSSSESKEDNDVSYDELLYIEEETNSSSTSSSHKKDDKFIRDTIFALIVAGAHTTTIAFSWFFYLLSKHPEVSTKIREELKTVMTKSNETIKEFLMNFIEHNNKLVYLHGAICETLRLYPPVPFDHKAAIKSDTLPSGHKLSPDMHIVFDMYVMGRMKPIWGDDCNEFKPERWITNRGNIVVEPTYKFLSFGAGPRVCQGKEMAFTQLKIVIASILLKYDIEVVKGQQIVPQVSVLLPMKHGMKVKIKHHQN